ncbi:MAG: hypothetical protein AAB388_01050 [Patescibacteria group bacterium]
MKFEAPWSKKKEGEEDVKNGKSKLAAVALAGLAAGVAIDEEVDRYVDAKSPDNAHVESVSTTPQSVDGLHETVGEAVRDMKTNPDAMPTVKISDKVIAEIEKNDAATNSEDTEYPYEAKVDETINSVKPASKGIEYVRSSSDSSNSLEKPSGIEYYQHKPTFDETVPSAEPASKRIEYVRSSSETAGSPVENTPDK